VVCIDADNMFKSVAKWEDPEAFDSGGFLKLRQQLGRENLHQFASLDSDMPTWGGGSQASPGRFLADSSIKGVRGTSSSELRHEISPACR
jgi:hypothetical protein